MVRGKQSVCRPRDDLRTVDSEREVRDAAAKIEVLHSDVEAARPARVGPLGGASLLRRALIAGNNLPARGVLPRRDIDDLVSAKARVFSFEAPRIMSGTAERIGNAGFLEEVLHDSVSPD